MNLFHHRKFAGKVRRQRTGKSKRAPWKKPIGWLDKEQLANFLSVARSSPRVLYNQRIVKMDTPRVKDRTYVTARPHAMCRTRLIECDLSGAERRIAARMLGRSLHMVTPADQEELITKATTVLRQTNKSETISSEQRQELIKKADTILDTLMLNRIPANETP